MTLVKARTGTGKTTSEKDRKLPHPLKILLAGRSGLKNFYRNSDWKFCFAIRQTLAGFSNK